MPIATGWGAGAGLQQPMAIALVGGLIPPDNPTPRRAARPLRDRIQLASEGRTDPIRSCKSGRRDSPDAKETHQEGGPQSTLSVKSKSPAGASVRVVRPGGSPAQLSDEA